MKTLTIGTELEFTGIGRREAAETVAKYFGTTAIYNRDSYDSWTVAGADGRKWKILCDTSIKPEEKRGGEIKSAGGQYRCELVTPILKWEDLETLQEIVWRLKRAGGFVNESCGQHVHVGSAGMTATMIRNLVNTVASREELFFKALNVHESRKKYCKATDKNFLNRLNAIKPETKSELKKIWYGNDSDTEFHYHKSRYHVLNLHALFTKGTIEIRGFNGTLEPVEVTAAIHLSAALIAFAKRAKKALYRPVNLDNAKFAMRTFLTRPQGLNLNGADYAMTRHVLTKNLEGNGAWRFAC